MVVEKPWGRDEGINPAGRGTRGEKGSGIEGGLGPERGGGGNQLSEQNPSPGIIWEWRIAAGDAGLSFSSRADTVPLHIAVPIRLSPSDTAAFLFISPDIRVSPHIACASPRVRRRIEPRYTRLPQEPLLDVTSVSS